MSLEWLPQPVDAGSRPQSVVRYTGTRLGNVRYRGRRSRRDYSFAAGPVDCTKYVLDEDLPHFRALPDFEVLAEGRIDPQSDDLERQVKALVAAMLAETAARPSTPTQTSPRRGGRPRVPRELVAEIIHLRLHVLPSWSLADLGERYADPESANPAKAISARLTRARSEMPELFDEDRCDLCRSGWDLPRTRA